MDSRMNILTSLDSSVLAFFFTVLFGALVLARMRLIPRRRPTALSQYENEPRSRGPKNHSSTKKEDKLTLKVEESRPSSCTTGTQTPVEALPSPVIQRTVREYTQKLIVQNVLVKTSANTHIRTNLSHLEVYAFAPNLETLLGANVVSLSIRQGCIIAEAQLILHNAENSSDNLKLIRDLVNHLHLEKESWDHAEPMEVRVHTKDTTGLQSSAIFAFKDTSESWELISSNVNSSLVRSVRLSLTFRTLVMSIVKDHSPKILGIWDGPPPPNGSSIEAVIGGLAVPVSCFPESFANWCQGTEIKLTVDLAHLSSEDGGVMTINIWSPETNKRSPETNKRSPHFILATARLLLLPLGSQGVVAELRHVLSQASASSPSRPFGTFEGLVEDIGLTLCSRRTFSSTQQLDPNTLKLLINTAEAVMKWAVDSHCPSLCLLMKKVRGGLAFSPKQRLFLHGSWRSYEINLVWAVLFSSAICMGAANAFLSSSHNEVALLLAQAWPYLLAILLKLINPSKSSMAFEPSCLFVPNAGLILTLNRGAICMFLFCLGKWQSRRWYLGDWCSFTYLLSKTLYTIFEPFDLREFVALNLLIDVAEVSWVGTMSGYSTMSALIFGFASISLAILIRLLRSS